MSNLKRFSLYGVIILSIGFFWLGCEIPVSPLPNVGDEIRLTNDPGPNRDPFWYTNGDPDTLDGSQICYHDGRTIYLYDWDSGAIIELYTAPAGYEITTLDGIKSWWSGGGYAFALYGEGQAVVIAIIDDENEVELLRDQGPPIESMSVNYDSEDDPPWNGKHFALVLSRNLNMYIIYTNGSDDASPSGMSIGDGFDIYFESELWSIYFIKGEDGSTSIYELNFDYDGNFYIYEYFNDGYINRYPTICLVVTNKGISKDIWNYYSDCRVTNNEGEERELDQYKSYVLFNRVTDGQSDLYVARWVEQ